MDHSSCHILPRSVLFPGAVWLVEWRSNQLPCVTARSEIGHEKEDNQVERNVFVDLGFDPAEAAVLQMRANVMGDLRLYIQKNRLTESEAAKRLGIAQSRVSDLVRGKWDKFSLEMLITLEARLGRTVRVEFAA